MAALENIEGLRTRSLWGQQLRIALDTLVSPRSAFVRLREKPTWVVVLIILVAGNLALFRLLAPYASHAALTMAPPGLTDEQVGLFQEQVLRGQTIGFYLVPALVMLKWAAAAGFLWILVNLFVNDVSFEQLFSLAGYANLVPLLESGYVILILALRKFSSIHSPLDLQVPIGLNLVVPTQNLGLYTLLGMINLFELWYVYLLMVAIEVLTRCSRRRAGTLAISYWLFGVAISVGSTMLSSSALHFESYYR